MKWIHLVPLILALALPCLLLPTLRAEDDPDDEAAPVRSGWEHLALTHRAGEDQQKLATRINGLGREGWELVAVTEIDRDLVRRTTYYFKRPL